MGEKEENDVAGRSSAGSIEDELRTRVRREEAAHGLGDISPDSLWDHLSRVATIAEQLGFDEGLDPETCRLAGLFHDAGKFYGGRLHGDDVPEEKHSIHLLRELAAGRDIANSRIDTVAEAIEQLYLDNPDLTPLARVLFDADNLDKVGPLGIANFFVKRGLRGRGVSTSVLYRFTVELTYARHAESCMYTAAGRQLALKWSTHTENFLKSMLDQLREEKLADFVIEEVDHEGLTLVVAAPLTCSCGGPLTRNIWEIDGIKCSEIHLAHGCDICAGRHEIRFCRPRLVNPSAE